MASEPIVTTSLADEIAFRLETAILGARFPPGSRLPQEELCERFAVSRTPVREALRKLQAKNLVVVVPNKGATVRPPSRKELLDIYAVRAELEAFSCELAAARITDACITELDRAQGELEDAVGLADLARSTMPPRPACATADEARQRLVPHRDPPDRRERPAAADDQGPG